MSDCLHWFVASRRRLEKPDWSSSVWFPSPDKAISGITSTDHRFYPTLEPALRLQWWEVIWDDVTFAALQGEIFEVFLVQMGHFSKLLPPGSFHEDRPTLGPITCSTDVIQGLSFRGWTFVWPIAEVIFVYIWRPFYVRHWGH